MYKEDSVDCYGASAYPNSLLDSLLSMIAKTN